MSNDQMNAADRVWAQRSAIPAMYGAIDFSVVPERFAAEVEDKSSLRPAYVARRGALLADRTCVDLIKAYTMLGDEFADAYAALIPQYGFRGLVQMLDTACAHGVESVPDCPSELVALIGSMAQTPDWLDLEMIREGARIERNSYAHRAPFAVRGGLLGTFMNKYAALPMALTGTLSNGTAARRTNDTATFFTLSVLPGALERGGAGFKAAAMVRLMHSMVRFNILRRPGAWDSAVYGIPIPQVDQMPAGLLPAFILSQRALQKGRDQFTPSERARVELARYRCFLLGLPRDLLADSPKGTMKLLLTRHATLRAGFDENCRALVEATMQAELFESKTLGGKLYARLERGFSKVFFLVQYARRDRHAAEKMGVVVTAADYAAAFLASAQMAVTMGCYAFAARIPLLKAMADRSLIRKIEAHLKRYGHAEFVTNEQDYKNSHALKRA